jgi:hypothetical protein
MTSLKPDSLTEKEFKKMAKEKKEEEKVYANPILYLHKSKAGGHLYAFNVEKKGGEGMVLGEEVESLILNVSDVSAVLDGQLKWAKVSIVLKEEG